MNRKMVLTRFKSSNNGIYTSGSSVINVIDLPMGILGTINGKGYVDKIEIYDHPRGPSKTSYDVIRPDKVKALIAYSQRVQVDIALNNGFPRIFDKPLMAALYLSWVRILQMVLQKEIDFKDQDEVFITIETVEG